MALHCFSSFFAAGSGVSNNAADFCPQNPFIEYVTGGARASAVWRAFGGEAVEVEVEVENIEVETPLTLTGSSLYVIYIPQHFPV